MMLNATADELPRIMACNGSRLMSPAFPPIEGDQTIRNEGTAVHWAAVQCFDGTLKIETLANTKAPNGVIITSAMVDHIGEYLSSLDTGEMEAPTDYRGEGWSVGGRCDHRSYRQAIDTLTIDDLKYGYRIVEPERNWTLLSHAIGTCFAMRIQPAIIVLRIHQPRAYHPGGKLREWRLGYEDLIAYFDQINATLSNPSDELRTGLSWCAKCHALANCPAAREAGMNAIDATGVAFNDEISNDVLSYELDTLRTANATVKARLDALEEMAKYRLKNGGIVENYASEITYANTTWKPGVDDKILRVITGKDLSKSGTVTPAEAKRRGADPIAIDALTHRPTSGTKLVRMDANTRAQKLLGPKTL